MRPSHTLFVYDADLRPATDPARKLPLDGLAAGSTLQLAPNGRLYCASPAAIFEIKPVVPASVTAKDYAESTAYTAGENLALEAGAVPRDSGVVFQAGETITIAPGFAVPVGSEASFTTGK